MKLYHQRRLVTLEQIQHFLREHLIALPRAVVLSAQVDSLIGDLQEKAAEQVGGHGEFRSGAAQRRMLSREIRAMIAGIAETAASLDPEEHPGIAERFRNQASNGSYAQIMATAQSFIDAVAPIKTLFTDRAHPEDFDTRLRDKIAAFHQASQLKQSGRHTRNAGTAGITDLGRRITKVIKELRTLVCTYLRERNPALLPVWNATARTERGRRTTAGPSTENAPSPENPAAPADAPIPLAAVREIPAATPALPSRPSAASAAIPPSPGLPEKDLRSGDFRRC